MTDSELLTIIISGLSFFVSFRGIIIAKKAVAKADEANALSREQNVLALRQAKSAEEYIDDSIARLIYIGVILAIVSSKAFYM